MRAVLDTLGRPGVARAALAYYRHLPGVVTEPGRRSWRLLRARTQAPTLMLTGELDGCMDSRLYDVGFAPDDFAADAQVERIEGAGHFLHLERPDEINGRLINWLARHA